MPRRDDIRKVLLIGSGPIVIGQACEFDYSGSQACKALREEGYQVVLVNNNPATIMTDPDMADQTYIEPLTPEIMEKIIARERPDVMLPTVGGQTGLNIAAELARNGTLERYGVELIGAKFEAIERAEKRELFREIMEKIGLEVAQSLLVHSVEEALAFAEKVGYPVVIRPSYTLGGTGGGIAYNVEELREMVENGLDYSPVKEVLVEESVIGWKEYELEVMRDRMDNVVIICSIENFDPMGIHTGDSITVAPAQTLSDKEYQRMRDAAMDIIRAIGVETGGSNIQFAVDPETGRMLVVEMNPRVSRSSALASKASGFPIAKIAAKLAVGYTLDEIPNDITKKTPASFEPTIDYCVVKIPRWDFAKFPGADTTLTTQMKSVGEVMAIGRTFKEALQKAIRSLEQKRMGLGADGHDDPELASAPSQELERIKARIREKLVVPRPDRLFYLRHGFRAGMSIDEVYGYTKIDKWFLYNLKQIVDLEAELAKQLQSVGGDVSRIDPRLLLKAKSWGFSDYQIAFLAGVPEAEVRERRIKQGVEAVYKLVDTCAAEFEAHTPYYYSTYEAEDEVRKSDRPKVMILGGGPNRIGQGIEFDYCCVQAAFASKEENREVIMVNCNPETVSTDYDTSDKLYFEPLTLEDVLNIYDKERPEGVILQFGGQTPLKLALSLEEAGVPILGTSPRSIDLAEDREKFAEIVRRLGLLQPPNGTGRSVAEAKAVAQQIGYPVLVRPSYVLGGRAMEIIYDEGELEDYMSRAVAVSPEYPVLIDKFIEDATEIDVDAISDGRTTIIAGVMEHIEQAGVHSGDSSCSLPPYSLAPAQIEELKENTRLLAQALNVVGLINIQYAIKNDKTYILEVNPRASRTVPFVSKATGIPWAKVATKVMLGQTLAQLGIREERVPKYTAVKEAVFPFVKFPGVDIILGPEMRSTGEVMGIDESFGAAFAKSQVVAETPLPLAGTALITVADKDKAAALHLAQELVQLGFTIWATPGTAKFLRQNGFQVTKVNKLAEGRPHILDHIKNGHVDLLINTPVGKGPKYDEYKMRRLATMHRIPIITTIQGARAAVEGIKAQKREGFQVKSIQEYHASVGLS